MSLRLHHPLLLLSGLLVSLSVAIFPVSQGSILADLPEVIVPLGVSLGIALYSVRLLQADYDVDRVKRIALYGWEGALVSAFGIWVLAQQLQRELAGILLFDEALTAVSVSSGTALFLGAHLLEARRSEDRPDRGRVLAETVWTNDPQPNSILTAAATQIAELEGVDPLELEPLYEYIDPDVFADLQAQIGSRWQLRFYANGYEIRVSGQGTVTIYDTGCPEKPPDLVLSRDGRW